MSKDDAEKILNQLVSTLKLTRAEYELLMRAIQALKGDK